MKENNKYLFSVVVYISNDYAQQTIDSIVSQDIGFKEKIQLIIACNRSVNSEDLTAKLQKKYADNVVVLNNVSDMQSAYTQAQKHVKGKYVNFAECGAVYEKNAFSAVESTFKSYGDSTKIVMAKCNTMQENYAVQDLMRSLPKAELAIDLKEKSRIPLVFFSYCFINCSEKLDFSNGIAIDELFQCRVLIELFEKNPVFVLTNDELVTAYVSKRYYKNLFPEYRSSVDLFKAYKEDFLDRLIEKYSSSVMPSYVQFNALMYTEWCASEPFAKDVAEKAYPENEFKQFLSVVLNKIDDSYILNNRQLQLAHKIFLLSVKNNGKSETVFLPQDKKLYFGNTKASLMSNNITKVEFVDLKKDKVKFHIRAKFLNCSKENFSMYALINGKTKVECKSINRDYDTFCWNEPIYVGMTFELEIDLTKMKDAYSIELYCIHDGYTIRRNSITFEKFSPLSSAVPNCYYYKNGHILSYNNEEKTIVIEKANGLKAFGRELKYLATLIRRDDDYARNAFLGRIAYRFLKLINRKKIWLISDRTNRGDDNGEALIKYLNTVKNNKIKYYFVVDKNSDEGKRISKFAKVISPNSKKHKFYHLLADYVISSQANMPVVNPFISGNIYYRDILCNMKFVFLQHGVTKDDMSDWLTIYNRNMYGFVVATNQEYQSVFDYNYFYPKKNVWLTGFSRFDLLYHDEQKYITFMPTWRKYVMKPHPDPVTGMWLLGDDYKDSEYCRFYNALFNDERLLKVAKEHGYTLCFKPHPAVEPYMDRMFDLNDNILILKDDTTYREVFAKTNLMLTDFSSVVFDFAYLRKPVVYAHFDKEAVFAGGHTYAEGYFDYERDGFGEVTYNLEDTVNCIIDYIKNDCQLKDEYRKRIDNTFAFSDKESSKRIYEHLINGNGDDE